MPKRSNEFQKLVTLIHRAMAPQGATVTESAMVKAPGFGELREIDVLLESDVTPYRVKIAIEAKDHKRKLSVTDIEAIIGKYRVSGSLIVDKVVLVTRRGVSNQAASKARVNGIELITLSESNNVDWQQYLPAGLPSVPKNLRVAIQPHVTNVRLKPLGEQRLPRGKSTGGRIICRCHRRDFGSPPQYAEHVMKCHLMRDSRFRSDFNATLKKQKRVCVRVGWPMAQFLLAVDGQDCELAQIEFHIHATDAVAPVTYTSYQLDGDAIGKQMLQHAKADVAGHTVQFVMPEGLKSKKIALAFGDCSER